MFKYRGRLTIHKPVLVDEVIKALGIDSIAPLNTQARHNDKVSKPKKFIDATVGAGGHSAEIVKLGHFVLGIDDDEEMLKIAKKHLEDACPALEKDTRVSFKLIHGNFKDIDQMASNNGFDKVDGIVFDLGVSTIQLTSDTRGFSFQNPKAELDMRINKDFQSVTGADLVNSLPKDKLMDLFTTTITWKKAKKLSEKIIEQRKEIPIKTVGDFLQILGSVYKQKTSGATKMHAATLPFLALRIAVNSELENLQQGLQKAVSLLKKDGRLIVISFHSGEDAVVKQMFRGFKEKSLARILTIKPIIPTELEKQDNPSARSAKMRVLQKI